VFYNIGMRTQRVLGLCLGVALLVFAQDWTTVTAIPSVDFTGLTPAQKTKALKVLREADCSCHCGLKVAECRIKDSSCMYSKGMAEEIVNAIRQGKTEAQALAAAKASKAGQGPPEHNKTLEDPVAIPVTDAPVRGVGNAKVTLVEFSDFQCPFCIEATPQLESLLRAYPMQVKLIFKQFPLDSHSQAALAAAAALSAHKQGKFWPMYDALFAVHGNLSRKGIFSMATSIGLDMKRFQADLDSPEIKQAVQKQIAEGEHIGVDSTPTLFVDGQRYNGPITVAALKPIVESELKHPRASK
jgi:protein-disulfide isomerase